MKTIGAFGESAEMIATLLTDRQLPCEALNPETIATVESLPEVLVLNVVDAIAAVGVVESLRDIGFFGQLVVMSKELLMKEDIITLRMAGADHCLNCSDGLDFLYATVYAAARVYEHKLQIKYTVGDLTIDTAAKRVLIRGMYMSLRPSVYDLLLLLVRYPNRAFSREELLARLRPNKHQQLKSQLIAVMVVRLRELFAANNCEGVGIRTVRGHGYQLEIK